MDKFKFFLSFIVIMLIFTMLNLAVHQVSVEENKRVKQAAEDYVVHFCSCNQDAIINYNTNITSGDLFDG